MKFIVFFTNTDTETAKTKVEAYRKISKKLKEQGEEPTIKSLSPPYVYPDLTGGFQLLETNSAEGLAFMAAFYDESEFTFQPILEMNKAFEVVDELVKLSK